MEPNRLEEQFRDKLEQRTIQPSKMAWDRLDAMLSVNEEKEEQVVVLLEKKKPNRSWMYMAASFVLFATIGAFFLTREKESIEGDKGSSVVTTENPVQQNTNGNAATTSGTLSETNDLTAPEMQQDAVAATQGTGKQAKGTVTVKAAASQKSTAANDFILPANKQDVAAVTHEGFKENTIDPNEAEKLLAASSPSPKKKASVKVDANSLLSSVEGELDESFRDKAFQGVIRNFNAVKSSVANRNYQ